MQKVKKMLITLKLLYAILKMLQELANIFLYLLSQHTYTKHKHGPSISFILNCMLKYISPIWETSNCSRLIMYLTERCWHSRSVWSMKLMHCMKIELALRKMKLYFLHPTPNYIGYFVITLVYAIMFPS
jgi:hypothetical protein